MLSIVEGEEEQSRLWNENNCNTTTTEQKSRRRYERQLLCGSQPTVCNPVITQNYQADAVRIMLNDPRDR